MSNRTLTAVACTLTGTLTVASFVSCGSRKDDGDGEAKRLNVIYIMCDDHSYQTISAYDSRFIRTPNIDRIADEGARFTNSFVANSLSGPSRACMLTGKHSHANGFTDNTTTFDGGQQTFPKILQAAGYQTAMIGKWHLVSEPTGFDHWDILVGQGDYYNPTFIRDGERVCREGYATNIITDLALEWLDKERDKDRPFCLFVHHKAPHRTWMPDLCDLELFSDAEFPLPDNFYDEYDGRIPASLQEMSVVKDMDLVYDLKLADKENEIHTSTGLEQAGRSLYDRFTPAQKKVWDAHYDPIIEEFKRQGLDGDALARWKFRQYMRDYLRVIHSVDRNVGRLLDYLESNGLMDNTMIVYTSDQGFYMGEHGWFDKRFMYEESLRTPLIVSYPGHTKPGSVCNRLVQNIDYAPTFLALAGVSQPKDMPGRSLVPVLNNGDNVKNWRQSIYYHYYDYPTYHMVRKHDGVRTDRYKLIHFYGKGGLDAVSENKYQNVPGTREYGTMKGLESIGYFEPKDEAVDYCELYDLQADPHEQNNIFGKPGTEKITKQLQRELDKYRKTLAVDEY